jgi:hypothetical protein
VYLQSSLSEAGATRGGGARGERRYYKEEILEGG